MSDPQLLVGLILGLPLGAALLVPLLSCLKLGKLAHLPVILAFAGAAVASILLLLDNHEHHGHTLAISPGAWFSAGNFTVQLSVAVDPLSTIMLATVTFIATWIALFSAGYMHDDDGYARYFSVMSLFVFSMCLLVLANDFLVLVAGWEGVGLCSYLLVGYYYAKPSAAAAARKAFLVTRLGDVGLILGIFLLWMMCGQHTQLDAIFKHVQANPPSVGLLTAATLLLFCGAVGKSAQMPLYVWLPDAMEGPTPVSALIHAATMVTAGVYLLARCAPLFVLCPTTQMIVAVIGAFTAFLAAFIALTQTDLKRVLAYSTVSQLGFMFMALGTSGSVAPSIAISAALFHLFTHAFFKALLFLGSGSVMHAMGGVIDMRKFGGLRRIMPVTHITFLIGSAALAGLPLLSGFWSKDQILDCLDEAVEHSKYYRSVYLVVFGMALLTAAMTAFYTFRAYLLTFWGPEMVPHEAGHHAHESPRIMRIPLIVLAVGALIVGAVVDPLTHAFGHHLAEAESLKTANAVYGKAFNITPITTHEFSLSLAALSSVLALAGVGLAIGIYGRGTRPGAVPESARPLYALSQNKVYVDEIYTGTVVRPAELLAAAGRQFDHALDAFLGIVAKVPEFLAGAIRPLQNGLVQFYALSMVLGLAVFVSVIVFWSAR
ncbi:MAG: NADH-quinone oxidoreductase subunit L [Gemmataceae bacterium]